jgi:hypothetical protein
VASYVFPAGGQRGKSVDIHVGGLYLYKSCSFELLGPGVEATSRLERTATLWFEGPLLPLPDSQQPEDYPKDMAGQVRIAADAPLGLRRGRVWTSQGAASGLGFVVGDLPELVEQEIDGDPIPVDVQLPVTINGRIFPREDVDVWSFAAKKGQPISCEVCAARLGSPLDGRLEVLDSDGRVVAENDDALGADPFVRFTPAADGKYAVRIRDAANRGGPAFVYRLTLTADPRVDRVFPLGGRRGEKTRFTPYGQGVPADPVELSLPADAPRDYVTGLPLDGKAPNPVLLDLDDLPEATETEPNDEPAQAARVAVPAMLNGRIDKPGDVDCWSFDAHKGDAFSIELRARQLGSPLFGVLTVRDAQGKELARAEAAAGRPDPALTFSAPADGAYCVRVADRFRTRGGPEFAYRLRLAGSPAPGFRLQLAADVLTLPRGGQAKLKVTAERLGGFADAIPLAIDGLPLGVKADNLSIPAGQNAVEITFAADAAAPVASTLLGVRGEAAVKGAVVRQAAVLPAPRGQPETDSVRLAVALPTPFKIVGDFESRLAPRGAVLRRKYRIERNGYDGPIEVSLADRQARHLQGVTGPTVVVPAGANEFEYAVELPPWMEIGRTSRSCVMGAAVIKDGDAEHAVSYTSAAQNEQMIAVVETGRLGVEAEKPAVVAARGKSVDVPLKVSRSKGLSGPVKVELVLPAHVRGLTADPVVVAAGQSRGVLALKFAADGAGPFNTPLVVRATLAGDDGPAVAETKLEVAPEN